MRNFVFFLFFLLSIASNSYANIKEDFVNDNIQFAAEQTKLMLKKVGSATGKNFPRTLTIVR